MEHISPCAQLSNGKETQTLTGIWCCQADAELPTGAGMKARTRAPHLELFLPLCICAIETLCSGQSRWKQSSHRGKFEKSPENKLADLILSSCVCGCSEQQQWWEGQLCVIRGLWQLWSLNYFQHVNETTHQDEQKTVRNLIAWGVGGTTTLYWGPKIDLRRKAN